MPDSCLFFVCRETNQVKVELIFGSLCELCIRIFTCLQKLVPLLTDIHRDDNNGIPWMYGFLEAITNQISYRWVIMDAW